MALDKKRKAELLAKMRSNQSKSNGFRDPTEWRPKFTKGEDQTFKLFILPPLEEGDICLDKKGDKSKCESDWDLWHITHGHHFINKRKFQCPRIHGTGDCPMCDTGFDLMRDVDEKEARRAIAKEWLSQENRAVNIYFANSKDNPEELRGKVLWWNIPNAIYEQCVKCIERDDAGEDEDDPKPFGLFFLPEEAYPISVVLKEKSGYNNYDNSKILAKPRPIADDEDEIANILKQRTDIRTKFDSPDPDALGDIVNEKLNKISSDAGFDDDDAINESKSKKKSRRSDDDEDEKPKSKSKSDDDDDEDEKPKSKSKSDDDDDEDEKPKSKSKSKSDDDDDEDEKPKSKSKSDDDDDEDEKPKSKSKSKSDDDDEDDDDEMDEEMQNLLNTLNK